ncbi:hypothetical protein PO909_025098 [Leuciscus waleckii]
MENGAKSEPSQDEASRVELSWYWTNTLKRLHILSRQSTNTLMRGTVLPTLPPGLWAQRSPASTYQGPPGNVVASGCSEEGAEQSVRSFPAGAPLHRRTDYSTAGNMPSKRCPQGTVCNPAASGVTGRSGLRRAHKGPPGNVVASGCSEEGARSLFGRSLPVRRYRNRYSTATQSRNQSREAGTFSRIFDSVDVKCFSLGLQTVGISVNSRNAHLGLWGSRPQWWAFWLWNRK